MIRCIFCLLTRAKVWDLLSALAITGSLTLRQDCEHRGQSKQRQSEELARR